MSPSEPRRGRNPARPPRTFGLKLIIAYKLVKAPLVLALALWLTLDPRAAFSLGQQVAAVLVTERSFLVRIGRWIHAHLTERSVEHSVLVIWLDGLTTASEAVLLLLGKPWAEWIVTVELALLLPFEVAFLVRKPSAARAAVLVINAAVVAYLLRRRRR